MAKKAGEIRPRMVLKSQESADRMATQREVGITVLINKFLPFRPDKFLRSLREYKCTIIKNIHRLFGFLLQ